MKWVLSVLFFACVSLSQAAVPACTSGCDDSHYCESSCYTDADNLLYIVNTDRFGDPNKPKCTDGTATCPGDLSSFDFANCQATCEADEACTAYILDQDFNGDRCRFLTQCMSASDAGVITPCEDCSSERKCSSCPQFNYVSGSTVVHWVCEMQGDAYSNKAAEGTLCKPTASCETVEKPALIKCKANDQDPEALGSWVDASEEAVPEDQLQDAECSCNDLRIPAAADTNLFCESEHTVDADGDYIIKSGDRCDLVCDAQLFIPIECRFNTEKTAASWHIEVDGDIDLGEDTTCLACSINNCEDETSDNPFNVLF